VEKRYDILSRAFTAKDFAKNNRNHWGIENSLHWLLDVAFNEDACRVHARYAAQNMVTIRHMILGLYQQLPKRKRSIKRCVKVSGWDNNFLFPALVVVTFKYLADTPVGVTQG
jgi:hypothetical protein